VAVLAAATLCAAALAACGSSHARSAAPAKATEATGTASTVTLPPASTATATGATTTAPSTQRAPTTAAPAGGASWSAYDRDAARSGVDPTAPPAGALRQEWTTPALDGDVYAQPLVVGRTVIVATENDTVYAFDDDTGALRWTRHLGTPVSGGSLPCGDVSPSGITGTPVADPSTSTVWVLTFSAPAHHTLWSIDIASGAVTGQRPADPAGADPRAEQQRAALALANSRVYVAYGGLFGDCSDYHGYVAGFPVSATGPVSTYETPTEREGGIWAPPGPVVGSDGSVYVATGNGTPVDAVDDSDSVVRLSPALAVEGTFTPTDFAALSSTDRDLGSTSPALLPGGLVFQVGKEGVGYLLSAAHLGGVGGQLASIPVCGGAFGGDAVDGDLVVVSCFDGLSAIRISPGRAGVRPGLKVAWRAAGIRPGPPIIAGGRVWAVDRNGALVGYDETTGAPRERSSIAVVGSFPSLAAATGRLYVPAGDRLAVFGGA
jgi:outer membrane protein assembly factor BamB